MGPIATLVYLHTNPPPPARLQPCQKSTRPRSFPVILQSLETTETSDTICAYPLAINRFRFGPQLTPQEGSYQNVLFLHVFVKLFCKDF